MTDWSSSSSSRPVSRPELLIRPVLSIDRVAAGVGRSRVLSLGPRTESEILALLGHGFALDNISALDLFSYSPWIEAGDMCAMPYADDTFDVVLAGWVLPYTRNPERAVREIVRVARPAGIVALGIDYDPESWTRAAEPGGPLAPTVFRNSASLLQLFGGHAGHVFFRHDAEAQAPEVKGNTLVVFGVSK